MKRKVGIVILSMFCFIVVWGVGASIYQKVTGKEIPKTLQKEEKRVISLKETINKIDGIKVINVDEKDKELIVNLSTNTERENVITIRNYYLLKGIFKNEEINKFDKITIKSYLNNEELVYTQKFFVDKLKKVDWGNVTQPQLNNMAYEVKRN